MVLLRNINFPKYTPFTCMQERQVEGKITVILISWSLIFLNSPHVHIIGELKKRRLLEPDHKNHFIFKRTYVGVKICTHGLTHVNIRDIFEVQRSFVSFTGVLPWVWNALSPMQALHQWNWCYVRYHTLRWEELTNITSVHKFQR